MKAHFLIDHDRPMRQLTDIHMEQDGQVFVWRDEYQDYERMWWLEARSYQAGLLREKFPDPRMVTWAV